MNVTNPHVHLSGTEVHAALIFCDDRYVLGTPCKARACAELSVSPFEGAHVIGPATIEMLEEPVMGMHYALEREP